MNTIKTKILILFTFIVILPGCKSDKSDTKVKTNSVKEISKTSSKKKKDKTKKNTTIKVDATINGKKIIIDKINPKYNSVVVLLDDGIQFKYTDINNRVAMVHVFDSGIYKTTPITFSQQVSALTPEEQMTSKIKRSLVEIIIPSKPQMIGDRAMFYKGNVVLEEFTDEKIVVNFKGEGFPTGSNNAKNKLFPMEGIIVVENYNIYDGRM
ncbi:MAG: hypothetical protein ABFR32_09580 [Bacteroidota bacterium]